MPISQELVGDAYQVIAFPDDIRALYTQLQAMTAKILRYQAGAQAVQLGTADARETRFVMLVNGVLPAADLPRIGALLPTLLALQTELEENYEDFIHPA